MIVRVCMVNEIKNLKFSIKEIAAVIIILFVAVLLRLYNLNELPVFADEAIYIRWAQVMSAESTLRFLPLFDGKQPLFMWSVIPLLKVISDPLIAGRTVSVLAGIGTLIGVFIASYILFKSKRASLLTGLFYAMSPMIVFFDRMALVDSMLTMFGIWFFVFSTLAVREKRLDMAMLAGFSLGGALLTKSPAIFFVMLLPTTILFAKWPKGKRDKKLFLGQIIGLWIVSVVIGYAMFNVLRLGPNYHMLSSRNYDYVYPYLHILSSPLDPFLSHLKAVFGYFLLLGPVSVLLLATLGILGNIRRYKKEIIVLVFWIVVPLGAILFYSKVLTARYILFVLPYMIVLAGSVFTTRYKLLKKLAVIGVILFILQAVYVDVLLLTNVKKAPLPKGDRSGYLEEWSSGTGIREVSEYIIDLRNNDPDSSIVVGTEGHFGTLPDGLQIYLNDYPEVIVVGVGVNLKEVPESLVESANSGNNTFLLMNTSRFLIKDPALEGLELISEYPKANRKDGSKESLLLFNLSNKNF